MSIKQKLASAKDKIKPHVPSIAIATALVSTLGYAIYSTAKTIKTDEAGVIDYSIRLVTGEEREKIVMDPGFGLYYVADDYYYLTPIDTSEV